MNSSKLQYLLHLLPIVLIATATLAQAQNQMIATRRDGGAGNPSPSIAVTLPKQYLPQEGGASFNANMPLLVPNESEYPRLRGAAPQWLQQSLAFPPQQEILKYLGREPAATRERAFQSITQVLSRGVIPAGLQEHLIPLSRWGVLYEDWRKHGGIDVFLTKYVINGTTILLMESHNHLVVVARELEGSRSRDFAGIQQLVQHYADVLMQEPLKPADASSLKLFRTSLAPLYIYGYYTPKIDVLTGEDSTADLITTGGNQPNESSTSARASAVRFFSNGDFVAFMMLKPVKTGELKNPFEPRFEALNLAQGEQIPFWEEQSPAARPDLPDAEELRRRQVREYLGSFFYDQDGNALTDRIPVQDLEREFSELSREQKVDIARRKIIDENYATGMAAFAAGETTPALEAWTRILQFEPENARAAILLQVGIKQRAKVAYGGNTETARRAEPSIQQALDAIARQQTLLTLRQQQEGMDLARERAIQDFRTRAIDFFSEGNYAESLREWDKLLNIEPGNANALLFKEICETKIKQAARNTRPRAIPIATLPPGSPGAGQKTPAPAAPPAAATPPAAQNQRPSAEYREPG
jgi:tetratricopeptide (TPR) repeat protein